MRKSVSKKAVKVRDEEVTLSESEVYDLVHDQAGGLYGLFEPNQDSSQKNAAFRIYDEETKQMILDMLLEELNNLDSGFYFHAS